MATRVRGWVRGVAVCGGLGGAWPHVSGLCCGLPSLPVQVVVPSAPSLGRSHVTESSQEQGQTVAKVLPLSPTWVSTQLRPGIVFLGASVWLGPKGGTDADGGSLGAAWVAPGRGSERPLCRVSEAAPGQGCGVLGGAVGPRYLWVEGP